MLAELDALVGERRWWRCVSVLDDKDAAGCSPRWRRAASGPSSRARRTTRALPPAVLESLWRQVGGRNGEIVADPVAALERARRAAGRTARCS